MKSTLTEINDDCEMEIDSKIVQHTLFHNKINLLIIIKFFNSPNGLLGLKSKFQTLNKPLVNMIPSNYQQV